MKNVGSGGDNPFLKSAAAATSSGMQSAGQLPTSAAADNPFLMHLAKPDFQTGLTGSSGGRPPPPTYAAVASGRAVGAPIPSFITHGPDSIPDLANSMGTFLMQPQDFSALGPHPPAPPPAPPPMYPFEGQPTFAGTLNPFLKSSVALDPAPLQAPGASGGPLIQTALNTGGLFGNPPPPPPPYPGDGLSAAPPPGQTVPPFSLAPTHPRPVAAADNRSLHLKGVPDDLNNHPFLVSHFSKFGHVESVECFPQKRWAKVTFKKRVSAATFLM